MDNAFLEGLKEVKRADPERTVEAIFRLFHSIEEMKIRELVAAKRTFDLFRSLGKIDESGDKIIDQLNEALIARAGVLWGSQVRQDTDLIPLVSAFGKECFMKRIVSEDKDYFLFTRFKHLVH